MTPATEAKRLVTFWAAHGSILTPGQIAGKYGGKKGKKPVDVLITVCDRYILGATDDDGNNG